jgi:hypothetical protein
LVRCASALYLPRRFFFSLLLMRPRPLPFGLRRVARSRSQGFGLLGCSLFHVLAAISFALRSGTPRLIRAFLISKYCFGIG